METAGAPSHRSSHGAVWTGGEMIIWGGRTQGHDSRDGARYDLATNAWQPVSLSQAPVARMAHTALWTGKEMIIWGGLGPGADGGGGRKGTQTGGLYDPDTDSWTATSLIQVPEYRFGHSVVWTGTQMIVWGGKTSENGKFLNSGALYDPVKDEWKPMSTVNAPTPRKNHSAVWTGTKMIVWGGDLYISFSDGERLLRSGGLYDPVSDTWEAVSLVSAPSARTNHTATWINGAMLIWGGIAKSGYTNDGGFYNSISNNWRPLPNLPQVEARAHHSAIWTGSKMIIWGGQKGLGGKGSDDFVRGGFIIDPLTLKVTSFGTQNGPDGGSRHTAVWTGDRLLVWGGLKRKYGGDIEPPLIKYIFYNSGSVVWIE